MENETDIRESVTRCVDLLKKAKTDSEKFAALLVVGEMDRAQKMNSNERTLVYMSIDLSFLRKLLNTARDPEGCTKMTLISVGLTILSCMVNEIDYSKERSGHLDILQMVPRLFQIMSEVMQRKDIDESQENQFEKEVLEHSLSILNSLASSQKGCICILKNALDFLKNIEFKIECEISNKIASLTVQTMGKLNYEEVTPILETMDKFMHGIAHQFSLYQDIKKFQLLGLYFDLLFVRKERLLMKDEHPKLPADDLRYLRKGIMDIIQSRTDVKYRHLSLKLVSILIELAGISWTYTVYQDEDQKYSQKFLHLIISLTALEINLGFHEDNFELQSFLFSTIENVIVALSCNEDKVLTDLQKNMMKLPIISKVLQTINEVISVLVQYLDEVQSKSNEDDACKDIKVIACCRLLCIYLSEETQALKKDIIKIAPFLIRLGKASFREHKMASSKPIEEKREKTKLQPLPSIFSFLLPVLCHWSADEKTRHIILEEDMHKTMWEYLSQLLAYSGEEKNSQEVIETLFGIFMNIAITEPRLAANEKNTFGEILQKITQELGSIMSRPVILAMNTVTLGLILARAQNKDREGSTAQFFRQCLCSLYSCCPYTDQEQVGDKNWSDIAELWLIGMDNLCACVERSIHLQKAFESDEVFMNFATFVEQNKGKKSPSVKQVCSSVLCLMKAVIHQA